MDKNVIYIKQAFYFILVPLFILLAGSSLRAQVRFRTVINPPQIALGEYIQIDYIIENGESTDGITPPSFTNFKILQGPSESTSVSIINGAVSQSRSSSYILQPLRLGKFTIPGAVAVINGKTVRSNAVTIVVSKNAAPRNNNAPPGMSFMPDLPDNAEDVEEEERLMPNEDAASKIAKNLMVKLDVNKPSCYVGEPIMATYKLYSRLRSESRAVKIPSFNGFSVYDMERPGTRNYSVEKLKGKPYNVFTLRKSQLIPLQAGTYTLDPLEVENKVEFLRSSESGRRGGSPMQRAMDEFFGRSQPGTMEEHKVVLKNDPVVITVNPLPEENKPESFTGAVGHFTIKSALKKNTISAGDVAELELVIDGAGNLPMINPPHLDLPAGMQAFDPAVNEKLDNQVYPLTGTKTINYTFLVKDPGDYIIPPVKFSYFDPASAAYKTLRSDSLIIKVNKSNKPAPKAAADTTSIAPVAGSGWTDIINNEILLGATGILLLIALVVFLMIRAKKNAPLRPERETVKQVVPEPVKTELPAISLKEAGEALEQGKSQEFYSEINKTIREAVYRKTDTLPSQMTKFNMPFILREKGVDVHTIQELENIMKECEIALYTPIHEERDMRNVLEKTERLISDL